MTFDAVLFDCDGVLVDSEAITCGVLRDMFDEQGWCMTLAECMEVFVGYAVRDKRALIEANTGQPLTEEWMGRFYQQRDIQLAQSIEAIPGIHGTVAHLFVQTGGRIACASGADRRKLNLMLEKVGLLHHFEGRLFSGHEVARNKPHPDVYLAAAAHLRVPPERCLVIEDTWVGVTAGRAAGATVWGYASHGQDQALIDAGAALTFAQMDQLPGLFPAR